MTEHTGFAERCARRIVRLAAAIAPFGSRVDFAREWEAELVDRFRPEPPKSPPGFGGSLLLIYRSLLSLVDAAHLRAREMTVESFVRDLHFAVRSLFRRPAFALLTLATIGLGIGANTAIFSVVNAVLLRPLPYPEPDELVLVWEQDQVRGWERVPASAEDFLVWREETSTLEALAAGVNASVSLTGEGAPERLQAFSVTSDFFDVFGISPLHGVPFDATANVEGQNRQVVLSHGLWNRRYGSDPTIVGRAIQIDGASHEVVAVMPEGFRFPSAAELWTPVVFSQDQLQDRNWHFITAIGRLAPGATVEEARAEMTTIGGRLSMEYPESNADFGMDVRPLHGEMTNGVRSMLWVLLGAVGFVLLIACANVANLLLVRASGRMRELSLRTALGAGKARIARQLLTESLLLSGVGAIIGLGLARLSLDAMLSFAPITVPGGGQVGIDGWVLGATVACALVTGLLFGLAPAIAVMRTDLQSSLRSARGQTAASGHRMRSVLVVTEIALALVLVTGAGLMVQSVGRMMDVDVGMETHEALVAQFSLPPAAYPDPAQQILFYDQVAERSAAIPGVRAAALSSVVPPAGGGQYHVRIEGVHDAWTMDLPVARTRAVSTNFFEAMGVPILRGRAFDATDVSDAPMVVIVDQAFVDRHFPGEEPIGRQIRTLLDTPREIVGVVGNLANSGLANPSSPTTYFPYAQHAFGAGQTLILRTTSNPDSFIPALQEAVWELDSDIPLVGVQSLEDRLAGSVSQPRFNSILLSLFALLAASLAAIGIFGVMSYTVNERTAELGLRMALGASGHNVRRLVLGKALGLTLTGILLGIVSSFGLTRVIESFLFGVEPTDPMTFGAVALGLCLVALTASAIPAVRASRLDPLNALRQEQP